MNFLAGKYQIANPDNTPRIPPMAPPTESSESIASCFLWAAVALINSLAVRSVVALKVTASS